MLDSEVSPASDPSLLSFRPPSTTEATWTSYSVPTWTETRLIPTDPFLALALIAYDLDKVYFFCEYYQRVTACFTLHHTHGQQMKRQQEQQ